MAAIALILASSSPALAFTIALHPQHGSTASGQAVAHQTGDGWSIALTLHGMPKLRTGQFYECWYAGPDNRPAHPDLITAGTFTVGPAGSAAVQMWSEADPRASPSMQITTEQPGMPRSMARSCSAAPRRSDISRSGPRSSRDCVRVAVIARATARQHGALARITM